MENIETLLAAVAQTQGFDDDPVVAPVSQAKVKNSDSRPGNSGGVQPPIAEVSGNVPSSGTHPPLPPTIGACVKRKRGRPPKVQTAAKLPPPKREKLEEEDEEDVCFICFDGGSLVLCDRKGCPKAYHPSCIKRDEAFFASNAKWICGWHICSVCMKTSHYTCYTCTYSLCKGCAKNTDYVCVRGNKGFCSTCMKTIMLIENKGQANNQSVQVDFDDKTSWEYLFKVYWVLLKEKLSLTFTELAQAKPPFKDVPAVAYNRQSNNGLRARVNGKVSSSSTRTVHLELNTPGVETSLLQNDGFRTASPIIDNCVDKLNRNDAAGGPSHKIVNGKPMSGIESNPDRPRIAKDKNKQCISKNTDKKETAWASKDLLEFVTFMRNGDTSPMPQSDVQTLLLDYIKRYSLWDSHQKSQIICDQRLRNLFGKPRIGHIEMLKLLELHFCVTEDSQKNSLIPAGFVTSNLEADGDINSTKRKTKEKNEERAPQNNLTEYAAIDVHNIKLVYLRRDLMENLLEDQENFNNKVTGSIVRIRTTSLNPKLDIYRLVQVVGTIKVAKPYKIGERTANVKLEVLNLDEKEVVSIDAISNEEFTEDECRRLRKSIRCGLVKQLTVGEVHKVAMALRPVRINYLLGAEILQLNHLQDQARKNGRKKELREYFERLQLLKSPEECQRRTADVPEIHADPNMSLNYESDEGNNSKKVKLVHPSYTGPPRNGRNSISPNKRGKDHPVRPQNRVTLKMETNGTHGSGKPVDHPVIVTKSEVGSENDQPMQRTDLETSTTTASVEHMPSGNNIETEKLWHYRDPNGQIQGPFSMRHMRIWNTTGLLPPDMRIWTNHEQYDSVLLTDALIEDLHGGPESSCKHSLGSQENQTSRGNGESEGTNGTSGDSKQTEAVRSNHASVMSENNSGHAKENASEKNSGLAKENASEKNSGLAKENASEKNSGLAKENASKKNSGLAKENASEKNSGLAKENASDNSSWPQCWDLLNDKNSSADDVQVNVQCQVSDELNHGSQNGDKNSNELTQNQTSSGNELQNQCKDEGQATQPAEENSRSLNVDLSSNLMESESVAPVSNSLDLNKQIGNVDLSDHQSPTPTNAENQPSVSGVLELLSPPPRSNNEDVTETKPSGTLSFPVLDSGPCWSGAPNVVAGEVQLPDVGNEWCGYSSTSVKPSVPEWESGLASAPLLKTEAMDEYPAASISDGHQIPQAPPPQLPASNVPNWLAILNEPIEFDALGEESVSDLLAEVDAMESQGAMYSPNSALKFAREFLEECKDDCFSSIEDFNPIPDPQRCDASGSTGEIQMTSQSSCNPIEAFDAFDSMKKSSVNSSAASSEGGNNTQVYSGDASSEFHPPAGPSNPPQDMVGHGTTATSNGSDPVDPSWGSVQGNINLVTVQGNVNLVLGGPGQGMANLGWGTNQGNTWVNASINQSPRNGSLPWDGGQQQPQPQPQQQQQQRKYGGERYTSPRSSYQGSEPGFRRPPRGRQGGYSGGGFSRPPTKGQRVCKFYESGHCKKGAFCDYLHP